MKIERRKWQDYSEEELYNIYQQSKSLNDFAKKIGYSRDVIQSIRKKYPWLVRKTHLLQIGDTYNKLTVIELLPNDKCKCKCECGNTIEVYRSNLTRNLTKSCGCLKKEYISEQAIIRNKKRSEIYLEELIGKTFGYLTVLEKDNELTNKFNRLYVKCKCNCGCNTYKSVRADSLKDGNTTSCGIMHSRGELKIKELLQKLNITFNQQISFDDLKIKNKLRFDFGIYQNNKILCLIEFQGIQHYIAPEYWGGEDALKETQKRDQLKRDYCKKNNLKLIEIPYTDFKILNEDYFLSIFRENNIIF